jgi:hypothetical protein
MEPERLVAAGAQYPGPMTQGPAQADQPMDHQPRPLAMKDYQRPCLPALIQEGSRSADQPLNHAPLLQGSP